MTELTNKEIENAIISNDIATIWNTFKTIDFEEDDLKKEYMEVKEGIKCKFDIRAITKEEYERKFAFGKVVIRRKKSFKIEDFDDEMDEREKIMKVILRKYYDDSFDGQQEEEMEGYEK